MDSITGKLYHDLSPAAPLPGKGNIFISGVDLFNAPWPERFPAGHMEMLFCACVRIYKI
jgi:hypothetical protein